MPSRRRSCDVTVDNASRSYWERKVRWLHALLWLQQAGVQYPATRLPMPVPRFQLNITLTLELFVWLAGGVAGRW